MTERGERAAGKGKTPVDRVAEVIRERSAAGDLVSASEILNLMGDECPDMTDGEERATVGPRLLDRLVDHGEDLHRLSGTGPPYYYSSRHMTRAYARLLLHKREDPLRLLAETVRDLSRDCRRPVPLDIFTGPPFAMTGGTIRIYLEVMSRTDGYDDIAVLSTSLDGVYLYSTTYLDKDHAEMLAEWLEVGQLQNP
ncbi:MAG: hypothetical protein KBG09_05255 [Syntrophobacterales bacterium]|nr:hypothetical protein [Syntrophobacterales bacterium]